MYLAILSVFLLFSFRISAAGNEKVEAKIKVPLNISNEDAYFNVIELIGKYGYGVELHRVVTNDGYVLEMHRITRSPRGRPKDSIPILLVHGLLSSSADWIIAGPEKGLGYLLADEGHDVWLANTRGSRYSRQHSTITVANSRYWQFSWHEIGTIDVPCMIDHVLRTTGASKLTYIGHSQGTTVLLVMLAAMPDYNERVDKALLMAPVAFLGNTSSLILKELDKYTNDYEALRKLVGDTELKLDLSALQVNLTSLCNSTNIPEELCGNPLFLLSGGNHPFSFNKSLIPLLKSHYPAGASAKQLLHYLQIQQSGKFQHYNYGPWQNVLFYRSTQAPEYPLGKVTVPVSVFVGGEADQLVTSQDVQKLCEALPKAPRIFEPPNQQFTHLDFLWGEDAVEMVYDKIFVILRQN